MIVLIRKSVRKGSVMATATTKPNARLSISLPPDLKEAVEEAASRAGQTVSQFAASALAGATLASMESRRATRLSRRDGQALMKLLNSNATPNKRLVAAAKKYKRHFGY
jgi:uncharacterized protein (DUF1778 family)